MLEEAFFLWLAAVLAVIVSLYIWKRRASAHERAARELLDDLAPPVRSRRGRAPVDAGAAPVPAWVMVFDVAICCTEGVMVLYSKKGPMWRQYLAAMMLYLPCNYLGLQTIVKLFYPGGSIWGRVGADAHLLLSAYIRVMLPRGSRTSPLQDSVGFVNICFCLLGAFVLIYRAFGWLTSGPDAERAAGELERELELEAERDAAARTRTSQPRGGARPGIRKRANRGRRRDASPRTADVQETVLEPTPSEPKAAPEPESETTAPEPEPEPAPEPPRAPPVAAAAPEEKVEEPVAPAPAAPKSKVERAAAPEGFEIVARVLEHLGEAHLLPIFEAEEINDNVLPCLDPADLIGLGVSQMTCLTILGAAHAAAKTKTLDTEDVLHNVAKHQSVLEEALRGHREEIKRLKIRELLEDLCCPITCIIMMDPVLCVEDGHTYERVAIEQ